MEATKTLAKTHLFPAEDFQVFNVSTEREVIQRRDAIQRREVVTRTSDAAEILQHCHPGFAYVFFYFFGIGGPWKLHHLLTLRPLRHRSTVRLRSVIVNFRNQKPLKLLQLLRPALQLLQIGLPLQLAREKVAQNNVDGGVAEGEGAANGGRGDYGDL